jgi:hypothetical protein
MYLLIRGGASGDQRVGMVGIVRWVCLELID